MKILFVASVYRHLTAFHIPYLEFFLEKGYEVYACANSEDVSEKKTLENMGIKCLDIPFSRSPLNIANFKAFMMLKQLKKDLEFDLIHTHTPVASFLIRMIFKDKINTKVIYTSHGFHFYKGAPLLNWILFYPMEKIASKWTDFLITINEEDYNIVQKFKLDESKYALVHGVGIEKEFKKISISEKKELRESLGIRDDELVISYVAELNANKNQIFLLKNWNNIKSRFPKVKLLIIGTGNMEKIYKQYVVKNNLRDIIFLGSRNDVMSLLQISDILTLLSIREGLGKCLLEGMICELPCIVSKSRGPQTLIKEGENGFLIDFKEDNTLVDRFVCLLENSELRYIMGKKGKSYVEEYYLENVIEEYKEIYENFLVKSSFN